MSLDDGAYRVLSPLKTDHGHFRVTQHPTNDPCVCDSGGQSLYIEHTSGDKYTIQYLKGDENFLGPSDTITMDNTVRYRPGAFEWTIESVGPGQFRVCILDQDMYWQIPNNPGNETKVVLLYCYQHIR
ncbi:hypothetical protein RhiJN_06653 [Ceratobasidium sp. AG-Ba]|nr:hypothetical protein RhiJN_06653 [Ceratobasidium sp. AG-Ba]